MKKVKVVQSIGLLMGVKNRVEDYQNVFLNLHEKKGTEVELSDKDESYVKGSVTRLIKAQKILQKAIDKAFEKESN